jgi:hypothetical protein
MQIHENLMTDARGEKRERKKKKKKRKRIPKMRSILPEMKCSCRSKFWHITVYKIIYKLISG